MKSRALRASAPAPRARHLAARQDTDTGDVSPDTDFEVAGPAPVESSTENMKRDKKSLDPN
eukprot:712490-Pyramimonas_sp.AAC.1